MSRTGHKKQQSISSCLCIFSHALSIILLIGLPISLFFLFNIQYKDSSYHSLVRTKYFERNTNNIYPMTTICFGDPFMITESQLRNYSLTMSPNNFLSIYPKFLKGLYWDVIKDKFGKNTLETFKAINYDNVTKDFRAHMVIFNFSTKKLLSLHYNVAMNSLK